MSSTATGPEVRMAHLSGRDARAIYAGNPVLLVPMGSHEDQGPHAPMGDYLLAERITELAALASHAAGVPAYVAPVIPYGGEDFFKPAVGGVVLEQATMTAVLTDLLASFTNNGLTNIILVNGHGGNVNPIFLATRKLWQDHRIPVPSVYLWEAAYTILPAIVGAEAAAARAGHGADPLGSVTQHLFPAGFKTDHVPAQKAMKTDPCLGLPFVAPGKVKLDGMPIGLPNEYDDIFHDGVGDGDPRLCDAATGAALVDRLVGLLAELAARLTRRKFA